MAQNTITYVIQHESVPWGVWIVLFFDIYLDNYLYILYRCLTALSSCCRWPPWWPPRWPTGPAVHGTPSASSSLYASGESRGSLMVSWAVASQDRHQQHTDQSEHSSQLSGWFVKCYFLIKHVVVWGHCKMLPKVIKCRSKCTLSVLYF